MGHPKMAKKYWAGSTLSVFVGLTGCNSGKQAEASALAASASAVAAASAAPATEVPAPSVAASAAPTEDLIPDSPELKRDAEYYYKEAHKKPKPAASLSYVRVPGGCTNERVMGATKVQCWGIKLQNLIYMQHELLIKDGWTIDKKQRGVGNEILLEASKGGKKIALAFSTVMLGTAELAALSIFPR